MAKTDTLTKAARQSVADQLGAFFPHRAGVTSMLASAAKAPELGESLAICMLTVEQVLHPPADLGEIAKPSGLWHHQVHTAKGATHTARSQTGGIQGSNHQVMQMLESPIAGEIDDALSWLERKLGKAPATVRLLVAPAYYLHALLIVHGKKYSAVLVDQPKSYARLEHEKVYPLDEFLSLLAAEKPSLNFSSPIATSPPSSSGRARVMAAAMPAAVAASPKSMAELDVLMRRVTPTERDLEQEVIAAVTGPEREKTFAAIKSKPVVSAVRSLHSAGGPEMVSSAIEGSGDFGGLGWRIYKRLHGVSWDVQGTFTGPATVTWKPGRDYVFSPDLANPLYFVRGNGQRIQPSAMTTDGGSIPRVAWAIPDLDPWAYLPAYLLHDWLFTAHHCVPDQGGSFEDANTILAEAIYTMMMTNMVAGDWRKVEIIYQAVSSFVGRNVWDRIWTPDECAATLSPTA